jgi:epoxyqueuosine reductase QueG
MGEKPTVDELSKTVIDFVKCYGACAAGITTVKNLEGGPPSTDLTYKLPNAKSAVCFAFPLDQSLMPPFLAKEERLLHEIDDNRANTLATGLAQQLADFLNQKGHPSVPVSSNGVYRTDTPRGAHDMMPDISLRYLAVRSGIGHFGRSGNVITRNEGAGIVLGATVTSAELNPTEPLPEEENYCDDCRLCMAACPSGLMHEKEEQTVTLGGKEFRHSKRRANTRCEYVCGGFAGLHKSGKWSTWTPARYPIYETDEEFRAGFRAAAKAYWQRPDYEGGFYHFMMKKKLRRTCGSCQILCVADKKERKRRYQLLVNSGVVVQNPDGSLEAVTPEEAIKRLSAMPPEIRALYEKID